MVDERITMTEDKVDANSIYDFKKMAEILLEYNTPTRTIQISNLHRNRVKEGLNIIIIILQEIIFKIRSEALGSWHRPQPVARVLH